MDKYQEHMQNYVVDVYIKTGRHLFVSDVAKAFKTNALGVRNTLGYDKFVFEQDDRWTGGNMTGRFIQSPCVEPTKSHLVEIIRTLRAA